MISLSVNVNKVATLRNSRGGAVPSVLRAAHVAIDAGAAGITVHPRADERHIRRTDVLDLAAGLAAHRPGVEYNIEGDPRPEWVELVCQTAPEQATLVPVVPGELTSQAGWPPDTDPGFLRDVIVRIKAVGSRVSVFINPKAEAVAWASSLGADRVELFTEPYARAFAAGADEGKRSFADYVQVAKAAMDHGVGLNAGHDLDLHNLVLFRELPGLDEVSIGHALLSRAVFEGLAPTVRAYVDVLGAR